MKAETLTPEELAELERLLKEATPGEWETDSENNEGSYGNGPNTREGFKSWFLMGPDGKRLFDAINSDACMVHEEYDEDGGHAWDETSRANAALIIAMHRALPALISSSREAERIKTAAEALLEACEREANALGGDFGPVIGPAAEALRASLSPEGGQ